MSTFKESTSKPTVKVLESCIPSIIIHPEALIKMQLFVEECTNEIGWLGTAYKEGNTIYIQDVILLSQDVHSATTEITPEGLAEFGEEILSQPDGMELWNNIKVWGHSHVNMTVYPSGQDESQMVTFAEGGHDWFIRIIANKKGDLRVDLYAYSIGVIFNDLPWGESITEEEEAIEKQISFLYEQLSKIQSYRKEQFKEDVKKEIEVKVRKKYYTPPSKGTPITRTNSCASITDIGDKLRDKGYDDDPRSGYKKTIADLFDVPEDVLDYFEPAEVSEIGDCESITEVENVLYCLGYAQNFSQNDLRLIWATGRHYNGDMYPDVPPLKGGTSL